QWIGRVPSGCATFTSAPARIRSSADLRFPASIRLARDSLEFCARIGAAASRTKMARLKRFNRPPILGIRQTAEIRNHRSAIWNILKSISLSIGTAGIYKDIEKRMFQIANRRLRIAVEVFPTLPHFLRGP